MQSALTKVEGVVSASAKKGSAVVEAKENVKVSDLIAALKKAGYGASEKS